MLWGMRAAKQWSDERGVNVLDSGAPWYDTYETRDGKYFAVGAIEPKFYAELAGTPRARRGSVASAARPRRLAGAARAVRARVRERGRATSGRQMFAGADACAVPVLSFAEAAAHPHANARGAHVDSRRRRCSRRPRRASRARRARCAARRPSAARRRRDALADWGFDAGGDRAAFARSGSGFA